MKNFLLTLALAICASTANAGIIQVSAFIDGKSELIIEDDTMFWHHSAFAAPGRWSDNDYPTIVNGINWQPIWPQEGRNDFCNCESSSISGLFPALSSLRDISLNLISGRGPASLIEAPTDLNGHRMEIEFDDYLYGGAAWYDIEISYSEVPESSSALLLLLGLGGLILRRISKR
ncbi:PEP-CTERM sorting domain-containing protein [Oceanicoccus sp. KOV_DT_Chl]|uniref:PEP-CTERM sorting domain-containing protein n=1 Tax=Oceanicoccus sp. KOV_DT_Chl TaxID=1904639 RepID=UPI000C7A41E7|nr:PEP-CTERM sorting domain-containing protein [Oceanicoccus sp. KOV_DT_Chl]